jgi:hypothetical protein
LNSLTLSVRLYPIFSPSFNLRSLNLREDYLSTRITPGFFDPKPRSSGIELRLGPSQIKFFSLYFTNFWEPINVFQLISQGYSKIQLFQKFFSLEALEAAGSGSNLGFNYSHLEKQDKESLAEVPNPRKTCIYNYFWKPKSTRNMLKLLH